MRVTLARDYVNDGKTLKADTTPDLPESTARNLLYVGLAREAEKAAKPEAGPKTSTDSKDGK